MWPCDDVGCVGFVGAAVVLGWGDRRRGGGRCQLLPFTVSVVLDSSEQFALQSSIKERRKDRLGDDNRLDDNRLNESKAADEGFLY